MNASEYKIMYDLENGYWYYVALRNLISSYFKKHHPVGEDLKILDAGCGTGAVTLLTAAAQGKSPRLSARRRCLACPSDR